MKKLIVLALVAAAVVGYFFFRSARPSTLDELLKWGDWSVSRREADPVGYSKFVEARLNADLKTFDELRSNLAKSSASLKGQIVDKRKSLVDMERVIDRFVDAKEAGDYPATVLGATYDEEELNAQISLLVGQIEQTTNALASFEESVAKANDEEGKLIVKIAETKDQLATIDVNRNLFISKKNSAETKDMLAEMSRIFNDNASYLAGSPIRDGNDLVIELNEEEAGAATSSRVEEYLKARRAKKTAESATEDSQAQ